MGEPKPETAGKDGIKVKTPAIDWSRAKKMTLEEEREESLRVFRKAQKEHEEAEIRSLKREVEGKGGLYEQIQSDILLGMNCDSEKLRSALKDPEFLKKLGHPGLTGKPKILENLNRGCFPDVFEEPEKQLWAHYFVYMIKHEVLGKRNEKALTPDELEEVYVKIINRVREQYLADVENLKNIRTLLGEEAAK
jgi:hypothetical protein